MSQEPITNNGKHPKYVGGACIMPGETRFVDAALVRPLAAERKQEPSPPAENPIAHLLDDAVKNIVPKLAALSDADLASAAAVEESAEKPRATLLAAMSEESLRRANDQIGVDNVADQTDSTTDGDAEQSDSDTTAATGQE